MSIDPQVIRAERYLTIGAIIQGDANTLIVRWSQRAIEEQPNAKRVHQEVLHDQLPKLLQTMGRSLAESEDAEIISHRGPALEHGEQPRWEAGWSLNEVVRDFQILRLVLLEYLEETLDRPLSYREVMAIGLLLDEAIAASVGMYVDSQEENIRKVERERAEQEKQAEEALTFALKQADRRKNEFLAMLGHELRNTLAPILNSIEVLRRIGSTETPVQQAREVVERQAKQMARLVDDLLDVSRISRGQVELRLERMDLKTAVAQALEISGPSIEAHNHHLSVSLPSEPIWVEGDQARLVQVMANLLNNAAKYTEPGGQIWITAEVDTDQAVFRMRDNGLGIPPEMLNRIFDLFTQVDRASERSKDGLGIGLTLVRILVELHGGTVTVHSAGLGQGSEFVIRLPALREVKVDSPSPHVPAPAAIPSRRVLVIEDHPEGRETIATLLRVWGHQVEIAEDGPRGIELALAGVPEVVLMDIGLPRMDGYQVARQLRAVFGDKIFLIALTGFGQADDRRRTMEAGFNAHLVKPVNTDQLSVLLATLPRSIQ